MQATIDTQSTVNKIHTDIHMHSVITLTLGRQNHAQHTYGKMFHTMENTICIISFTPPLPLHYSPVESWEFSERGLLVRAYVCACFMHRYLVYQSFSVCAYVNTFS